MVYLLFFDKYSQLVLEVRRYIFAVYKYRVLFLTGPPQKTTKNEKS